MSEDHPSITTIRKGCDRSPLSWGVTNWSSDISDQTDAFVEDGAVRGQRRSKGPTDGLQSWWKLTDDESPSTLTDSVGGHHGTLHVHDQVDIDVLVLGAGGGGGGYLEWGTADAGGGGAGGLAYKSTHTLPAGDYPATVGKGGVGSGHSQRNGENGGTSTFDGLDGLGGGGGDGDNDTTKGRDGGSGGGGAIGNETEGTPLEAANQGRATQPGTNPNADLDLGHDGGAAQVQQASDTYSAGGGGGAGEPGQNAANDVAGDGGDGKYIGDLFGDDIGIGGWLGAGGGGGAFDTTPGSGGKGGGGDGANRSTPEDAAPHTGSGEGGGNADSKGGDGANGLIIIRIPFN